MSGKTTLIDASVTRCGRPIHSIRQTSVVGDTGDTIPGNCPEKIVAIDDCQYLFLRRIGGFTALEKFLDMAASSERLYITTWNSYAWNYLEQVFDLEDYFPAIVTMPSLGIDDIEAVIGAHYKLDNIRYVHNTDAQGPQIKVKQRAIRIAGFNIKIPYFLPDIRILSGALKEEPSDVRRLIFEKITGLSHGNPGIALALWRRAYDNGEAMVGKVHVPDYRTDLDTDEAFVLGNILMMKSVTEEDLLRVMAGHLKMDRILYALMERGLVKKTSGQYGIEPLAMYDIVESLRKSRQVW